MHLDWTAIATQAGIGGGLFYAVTKFFDTVGERLNEDTRLEVAVWLLGVKLSPITGDKSSVPLKLFRAMCGAPDSKKRLIVSLSLCCANGILSGLSTGNPYAGMRKFAVESLYFAFTLVLIQAVIAANEYAITKGFRVRAFLVSVVAVATAVAVGIVSIVLWLGISFGRALSSPKLPVIVTRLSIIPAVAVTIWMWLPFIAGILLKVASRLDIGVAWFNRRFDIEKKPLHAIGLVAGALVAVVYWAAELIRYVA
jgi:hypothetical protein